jgi:hypothetical protein
MAEKKSLLEAKMMTLPTQRMAMGDIPVPSPEARNKTGQIRLKMDTTMENTVKRLIAHFKDEK